VGSGRLDRHKVHTLVSPFACLRACTQRPRDTVQHPQVTPPQLALVGVHLHLRFVAPAARAQPSELAAPQRRVVLSNPVAHPRRQCILLSQCQQCVCFQKTMVDLGCCLQSSWCTLIAKRTFVLQHGNRAVQAQPVTYNGMLTMLATSAYRAVMVLTSVIVSFALGAIPRIGPFIGFAFMCWSDAFVLLPLPPTPTNIRADIIASSNADLIASRDNRLICSENRFIWIARGLSLTSRVRHLEERWVYYFAFGFPSAAICTWGSGLANAALFALLFPAVRRQPYHFLIVSSF